MSFISSSIYFVTFSFICIIIYGYFYQHKDNYFSSDLIILKNFYSSNELKSIKDIIKKHDMKSKLILDTREKERKKYTIYDKAINTSLEKILINKNLAQIMEKQINSYVNEEHNYPIELRLYDEQSKGLKWHVDKALFYKPYYECVLTLENDTYSMFQYLDVTGNIQNIIPKTNTLVCITPNSIPHGVTPSLRGNRIILKFVVTFQHNVINDSNFNSEFNVPNVPNVSNPNVEIKE
jgi:hypothetical protein